MNENWESEVWRMLNIQLQMKKNKLRTMLKEKGVLEKGGKNSDDDYQFFSEAQYKLLFTELFSECLLELKFNELDYETYNSTDVNGRMPKIEFRLFDCETGFYEDSIITGEALDKGDKAGYMGYTGALKYYLATTFMVATGNDVELNNIKVKAETKEIKETKAIQSHAKPIKKQEVKNASPKQIAILLQNYTGDNLINMLAENNVARIEDLTMNQANDLILEINQKNKEIK